MPGENMSRIAAGMAAGLVASAVSSTVVADTDSESAQLAPLVVTPTRMAQTVDESLSSVSVIDRQEIDRQQPRQVADLLQARPGVSFTNQGGPGKASSLFMRGTNSDHTLLLVDGVRMGSATTGGASWQYLPPSEIERIEVVRGPRSSIYGADAMGGVVQVFTREGEEGAPRVNAFAGSGSFNTYEYGAGVAGGTGETRYSLSAGHFHTDGINVRGDAGDDDDDGYINTTVSGQASHRLTPEVEVFGNFLYADGESDFDPDTLGASAYNEFSQAALQAGSRLAATDVWQMEVAISQSRDEEDSFYDDEALPEDSTFDTRRDMARWHNELDLARGLDLAFGADWREDHVESTTDFDEDSRYNIGAYQVLTAWLGSHQLQGSLRYDDNEAYGSETTGQVAWGWQLTEAVQTRASYGTAFKAPTFNELYFPGFGNPDLDPESSESFELGIRRSGQHYYWDLAAFQTEIDDLIDFSPKNIDEARIRGAELETGAHWREWRVSGALTYLDHENRETGNELQRRPNESVRVDIDRQLGDFSLGATALARGRSYDDQENDTRLSGYGLLNLRTSYAITPEWTLRGTLENALDKDYETAAGYNQPGRAAYVSIHFQQQ